MPCHGSTSSSNLGSLVLQKIIEARNERRKKKKKRFINRAERETQKPES